MRRFACCCVAWFLLLNGANYVLGEELSPELNELVHRVAGNNEKASFEAARRLGKLGEEALPAVPALIALLDQGDVFQLKLLRSQPSTASTRATAVLVALGAEAVPQLADSLQSGSVTQRTNVVGVLQGISAEVAINPLSKAAQSMSEVVRERAVHALGFRPKSVLATETLLTSLSDSDAKVRAAAAWGISRSNFFTEKQTDGGFDNFNNLQPRIVAALAKLLADSEIPVRASAAGALGRCPNDVAAEHLIAVLPKPDDKTVRVRIVESLGEMANRRAVGPLVHELKKNDATLVVPIVNALGKLEDPLATNPLLPMLQSDSDVIRRTAAEALGEISDRRSVVGLVAALKDNDHFVRLAAATALSKIPDERAVEPLIGLLSDKDISVRFAAATALGAMNDARAIRPLAKALFDPKDRSTDFQEKVGEALLRIHDPDVVPALVEGILADGTGRTGTIARRTLEAVTGQSGISVGNETVAEWWKANRDYYQAAE